MTRILAVTKLTARLQTTVPNEVREFLQLAKSDEIVWVMEGNNIIVKKA